MDIQVDYKFREDWKIKQEKSAFVSNIGCYSQNTPLRGMGHERNLLL